MPRCSCPLHKADRADRAGRKNRDALRRAIADQVSKSMPSLSAEEQSAKTDEVMHDLEEVIADHLRRMQPKTPPLIIHQPNDHGTWSVIGDLREVIDFDHESTNYIVCDKLRAKGWSAKAFDPEYSCFYAYTDTKEAAIRLVADAIVMAEGLRDGTVT